jgi:hypothetical protein
MRQQHSLVPQVAIVRSVEEAADLATIEARIGAELERIEVSEMEVGRLLADIRSRRLYLGQYQSFETYVNARWDKSLRHVNRIIAATRAVDAMVEHVGDVPLPTRERNVRLLIDAGLTPEEQAEVWKDADAIKAGDEPTRAEVQNALEAYLMAKPYISRDDGPPKEESDDRHDGTHGSQTLAQSEQKQTEGSAPRGADSVEEATSAKPEPAADATRPGEEPSPQGQQSTVPRRDPEQDWLETLPPRERLDDLCRAIIDGCAKAWRATLEDRKALREKLERLPEPTRDEWTAAHLRTLRLPGPSHWKQCLTCAAEGGISTGFVNGSKCSSCKGVGYHVT